MEVGAHRFPNGTHAPYALNFDVIAHELGHLILYSTIGLPTPTTQQGEYFGFGELRTARSRNGDRVRPSARSSWQWDEAVPQPWFGRREDRAERAVSKRKGMGRLGAENDDRLR